MNVCAGSASSGLGGGLSSTNERRPARPCGWTWRWLGNLDKNSTIALTTSPAFGTLRKFFIRCLPGCFGGTGHPPVVLRHDAAGYRRQPSGGYAVILRRSGGGHSGGRVALATNHFIYNAFSSHRRAG